MDTFKGGNSTQLAPLTDRIAKFNEEYKKAMAGTRSSATTPETTTPSVEDRTSCSPSYSGNDRPIDLRKVVLPSEVLTVAQFEAQQE